jgi:hypothetical protein
VVRRSPEWTKCYLKQKKPSFGSQLVHNSKMKQCPPSVCTLGGLVKPNQTRNCCRAMEDAEIVVFRTDAAFHHSISSSQPNKIRSNSGKPILPSPSKSNSSIMLRNSSSSSSSSTAAPSCLAAAFKFRKQIYQSPITQ